MPSAVDVASDVPEFKGSMRNMKPPLRKRA